MKRHLSLKETILVASTLFGMFFGAGNLIFPVHMGQLAGSNAIPATIGFIITAVGIPILGVAAIGNTHSDDLLQLSSRVSGWYGYAFTTLLYLTIGPFFAIPRCATTSFTTGVAPITGDVSPRLAQLIFTLVFFGIVLFFSLRPSGITTWIGRIINPVFLVFLMILILVALAHPGAHIGDITPDEAYQSGAVFNGFIDGYNTMDAIAGLAFGIVIINVIRDMGLENDDDVARATIRSGSFTAALMGLIYVLTVIMGAQSRGLLETSDNGAVALAQISDHYLGRAGSLVLALTITFACLKTALGLVISCSEMFVKMYPARMSYRGWAVSFTVFSFAVSNVGLTAIINYAVPVLMLLYPLAIVLIVLALTERLYGGSRYVYAWVTAGAGIAAVFDCAKTLPEGIQSALHIPAATALAGNVLPMFDIGLGWVVPALAGLAVGLAITRIHSSQDQRDSRSSSGQ